MNSETSRKRFLPAAGGAMALTALGVLTRSREAVAAGSTSALHVSSVSPSGTGSETTPWAGWEPAVNAAQPDTQVYFPKGYYAQTQTIVIKPGWVVCGDGDTQSVILAGVSHDAFRSSSPINSSTGVHLVLSDFGVHCTAGVSNGAAITDVAGTFIHVSRIRDRNSQRRAGRIARPVGHEPWAQPLRFGHVQAARIDSLRSRRRLR